MTREEAIAQSSAAVRSPASFLFSGTPGTSSPSASAMASVSAKSKLLLFEVNFAGGRTVFRSGEKVSGWIMVETRGPVYATSYQIECLGCSEVPDGTAVPGVQRRPLLRRHLALKENLLPVSRLVDKRGFEFQLPRWLPHSVECEELGWVRYYCRAVATFLPDAAAAASAAAGAAIGDCDAIRATRYFTVIEDVDLNSPAVAQRCTFDETCCTSVDRVISKLLKDEVKASLKLKKDAYVPGENLHCQLSVHCSSSVPVQKIAVRLVQRTTAVGVSARQVGNRSRVIIQELATSDSQESGRYWSAKHKLHIPGVVASSLPNAHFQHPILVEYAIQMCVSLGFSHVPVKDLTLDCPIVIGTVPKMDSPDQLAPMEASFVEASHCAIPSDGQPDKRHSKTSFLAPFQSKRDSGYRYPQLQYTLYCIYYPTISICRQKQSGGLKSILKVKHSSIDGLDTNELQQEQRQQQQSDHRSVDLHFARPVGMKRSTSMGWYETPL